jgi:hypothetical protein
MKPQLIAAAALLLDYDLYPRANIDGHNIRDMADALSAGATLPPVIVDKKSQRVVDGFHRVKAYLLAQGPDALIPVIFKTYANDREMYAEAVRCNSTHGKKLDPYDKRHAAILGDRLGIPKKEMAALLNMSISQFKKMVERRTAHIGKRLVALKATIEHKTGQRLTKSQVEANKKLSGMRQAFSANQLILLIETGLLDTEDEKLMERLMRLYELLGGLLATK